MIKKIVDKQLMYRRFFLLICDIIIILAASALGLLFRFDFEVHSISPVYLASVLKYLPINIIITIGVFYVFRLYHSLWSFAGVTEMQNLFLSCIVSTLTQLAGMELLNYPIYRSYIFLYGGSLFILTMASRFAYRFFRIMLNNNPMEQIVSNVMIIGGGDAANLMIKETSSCVNVKGKRIKCIIDDALNKQGKFIQGIKVVGNRYDIKRCVKEYEINEIIIAMPSADRQSIRDIVEICKETDCELKILPGIYQLMNGEVSVSKLRKVEIEDLLGRDSIKVDLDSIMDYVQDKIVLVTGGGGSIGSELCRQIASHNPKQLIIVDIYENNAYDIQQELLKKYSDLDLKILIASVRNEERINKIFETYRPNIVYHAAAHKHVPLMETSPHESIKNNVMGTWNTVQAADRNGVSKFVLISTDKAVNPTNIMGASKRICEMIVQTYNKRSNTDFVAVRFGNVLGSNGSVIPLFKKQIEAGGPVTVTHPDIIRYFMTIPEAVSLVLQAGAYAEGGEIFVLDMGEPVKILDLATNLIRLSGYKPGEDIKIEFSGLRPGEKLYEELLMKEEGMQDTANKLIHIGKPIQINEESFLRQLEELKVLCYNEKADIRKAVQKVVPTYQRVQYNEDKIISFEDNNQSVKNQKAINKKHSPYEKRVGYASAGKVFE
jgi:FlaA1/EpsC-like NDP-sugar epimerase